jgi:hypothetical protein
MNRAELRWRVCLHISLSLKEIEMTRILPHKFHVTLCIALTMIFAAGASKAQDTNLTANYQWAPVQIGAGGWMRGMAVSTSNPNYMYARGDVGNVYYWNSSTQTWVPTQTSTSFPAPYNTAPLTNGGGAIAIDPSNPEHFLVAWTLNGSADIGNGRSLNVFESTNGGVSYQAGNLSLKGDLSLETTGERIVIDPNNGNVAYFAPPGASGATDGLQLSTNGGTSWSQVTASGLPVTNPSGTRYEFQLPRIDGGSGTTSLNGTTVSKILYVTYIKHNEANSDAVTGGGVLMSTNGGSSWTDITGSVRQLWLDRGRAFESATA